MSRSYLRPPTLTPRCGWLSHRFGETLACHLPATPQRCTGRPSPSKPSDRLCQELAEPSLRCAFALISPSDGQRGTAERVQRDGQQSQSFDPDARPGHQTETADNSSKTFFGYHSNVASTCYPKNTRFGELHLALAFSLVPAGSSIAAPSIRTIDSHITPFNPGFTLFSDREYTNLVRENWADKLLERRIEQYMEMTQNDVTIRKDADTGAIMFAGWPFVPRTPRHLFNIKTRRHYTVTAPRSNATEEAIENYEARLADLAEFKQQIADLAPYALSTNGGRNARGGRRFFVPTTDRALATPAQRATKVFKAKETVTVKAAAFGKHYQPHRWGTDAWIAAYSQRSSVEGIFGNLKSRTGQGVTRGWTRVIDIAANSLMVAAALVQRNIQAVRSRAHKQKIDDATLYDPLNQPAPVINDAPATAHQLGAPPAA